jgi:hypothetical protein
MGHLLIQITKRPDGGGLLRCVRADGSTTWQKQESRHAPFFALHDLTHFAVESTLGFKHGFFGLIAAGWDVEDTTGQGPRGELPKEAVEVEQIVGLLDAERASAALMTAEEFNGYATRQVTQQDLLRVRAKRGELFAQWSALAAGATLELTF